MNVHTFLEQLHIPSGHTRRVDCPECGGTRTLSVTNDLGLLMFNCYRASCKVSGAQRTEVTISDVEQTLRKKELGLQEISFPKHFIPITGGRLKDFYALLPCMAAIEKGVLQVYHDVKEQRLVFPVVHRTGKVVDATGRALIVKQKPKWKRYAKSEYPFICGDSKSTTAVVVEDCISAAAVAGTGRYTGCAVMGTSIHSGYTQWLKQFQRVIVALDYDATNKGLDYTQSLSWLLPTDPVILKKDLKEYDQKQILEILDNV